MIYYTNENSNPSVLELQSLTENNEFRLRATKIADNTVSLTLRIADTCGRVRNIHFEFYLDSDTAISIAGEMVEQLDLSHEDVSVIAELIDNLIMKLVPGWKPSSEGSSCGTNSSYGDHPAPQNVVSHFANAEDRDDQASMILDTSATSAEYGVPTASGASNVKVWSRLNTVLMNAVKLQMVTVPVQIVWFRVRSGRRVTKLILVIQL
ncbi:hypothetical protein PS1_038732 [Malus domestica]